jgi:DNA repair protein RadC
VAYRIPRYRLQLLRDGSQTTESRIANGPKAAADILRDFMGDPDREMLVALLLDVRDRPIGLHVIVQGSQNEAHVRVADVFKAAIVCNAYCMILGHNHPSGEAQPSGSDIQLTRTLQDAGKLLQVEVLDHIILGECDSYYSLKDHGDI